MSRLASCYFNSSNSSNSSTNKKEDLDKAIALNEECFMKAKLVYGDCHPSTLSTMYGLACDYATIGDYAKALSLHEDCFAKRSNVIMCTESRTEILLSLTLLYVS